MYNFQKTISDIRIVIHTDLHVDNPPLVGDNLSPEKRNQYSVTIVLVFNIYVEKEREK